MFLKNLAIAKVLTKILKFHQIGRTAVGHSIHKTVTNKYLAGTGLITPIELEDVTAVYHLYVVRIMLI